MWQEKDNKLTRTFTFSDFKEALAFIVQVGIVSEKQDHHPEIQNVYNKVVIGLSTHDAGNIITEKDRELAKAIDELR